MELLLHLKITYMYVLDTVSYLSHPYIHVRAATIFLDTYIKYTKQNCLSVGAVPFDCYLLFPKVLLLRAESTLPKALKVQAINLLLLCLTTESMKISVEIRPALLKLLIYCFVCSLSVCPSIASGSTWWWWIAVTGKRNERRLQGSHKRRWSAGQGSN